MEEPPLGTVEIVEQRNETRIIQTFIAEPLADMGPVFLFNVGIVVFVVGSASGERRAGRSGKMAKQMIVQELAAVIAVEAKEGKGKGCSTSWTSFRMPVRRSPRWPLSVQPVAISTKSRL